VDQEVAVGKYSPLRNFLAGQDGDHVPMTFAEIEKVLDLKLPASKRYPAWWSNNPSNNPMTREWLEAGFETESVNISAEKLVFRRVRERRSRGDAVPHGRLEERPATYSHTRRHPGFGFMKGLITIKEGFDVTRPFDDEPWDKGYVGSGS
jgi:hypothetical protein